MNPRRKTSTLEQLLCLAFLAWAGYIIVCAAINLARYGAAF